MFAKYLLVFAFVVYLSLTNGCYVYKGVVDCPGINQQTMVNTVTCRQTCLDVYPIDDCLKYCDKYRGPVCKLRKQLVVKNSRDCTKSCVDILEEGEDCNYGRTSICRKPLRCVDKICRP